MWEDNFMFHTSESILFGTLLTWLGKTSVIWILCLTEWWISRSMMRSYQDLLKSLLLLFGLDWVLCLSRFHDAACSVSTFPWVQIYSWLALSKITNLWQKQHLVAALFLAGLAVTNGWSYTDSGWFLQSRDKIFVLWMSHACMSYCDTLLGKTRCLGFACIRQA